MLISSLWLYTLLAAKGVMFVFILPASGNPLESIFIILASTIDFWTECYQL